MFYLYHIARPGFDLSEGYIGVSRDPARRLRHHRRSSRRPEKKGRPVYEAMNRYPDVVMNIVASGSEKEIYDMEKSLRPNSNMGWNTIPGGYASRR